MWTDPAGQSRLIVILMLFLTSAACTARLALPVRDYPADATATETDNEAASTARQALIRRGYQSRRANGQVLYCRNESTTGTQFRTEVCLTSEQIDAEARGLQRGADFLNQVRGIDCSGRQGSCQK